MTLCLLVVGFDGEDILVAAQTDNAYGRPLSTYTNDYARYIKILGVRFEVADNYGCYERIMNPDGTPAPEPDAEPTPTPEPAPEAMPPENG